MPPGGPWERTIRTQGLDPALASLVGPWVLWGSALDALPEMVTAHEEPRLGTWRPCQPVIAQLPLDGRWRPGAGETGDADNQIRAMLPGLTLPTA